MISVSFYKLAAFFARHLPQNLSESITELFVKLQYVMRYRSRRIIIENLRLVLGDGVGETELRRIRRRVFSNFGRSIYYFLRLPFLGKRELRKRCDYNGLDAVAEELANNGGFILVGPHLGAWEVGGACLASLGLPLRTVALPHPSPQVTRFFNERRRSMGLECMSLSGSLSALRDGLRRGKGVILLIDRIYGGGKATFSWFGQEVELPIGHVALAVRCGVPLVSTICVFNGDHGFKFVFRGPHYPQSGLGHRQAMIALQERCIEDMETFIQEYPDQWFQFQPFGE